jgi:CubicO group peptidase (beta-lactamase class C family)
MACAAKGGAVVNKSLVCALLVLVSSAPAAAQKGVVRFEQAYERLDAYVAQEMQAEGTPGLALALTNRDGLLRVATYGFADIKTRAPVTPQTRFEIGSISKSFTAISLLQLHDEGRFDPKAPVSKYLPWFSIRSKYTPVTSHDLLSHSGGLPRDRDDIPSSLYQAIAVRERETGYAPGAKFAYSNIDYQILSYLLESIEGKPYAEIIQKRLLDPLGMTSSAAQLTSATRSILATGYVPLYDDRPSRRSDPLVEGTWGEYGAGDGSIVATPADLAAYLRMLLNRGAGPKGRILSEQGFQLLIQRVIKDGDNSYYGYGLDIGEKDGHTIISHSGGMIGYSTRLEGDLDDGLGAIVFVNGPGDPGHVAEYALALLRAALHEKELPPVPGRETSTRIANAADYAGTYSTADGKQLTLVAESESLVLVRDNQRIPLERSSDDSFLVGHPDFPLFPVVFGRDKDKKVVEAFYGSDWYTNSHYAGPRSLEVPPEWAPYPGHYRTQDPWLSNFRVVLSKGKLWLAYVEGNEEELVPLSPGLFQIGVEPTAERLQLDTVIEGKAQRAILSGKAFYRTFTP